MMFIYYEHVKKQNVNVNKSTSRVRSPWFSSFSKFFVAQLISQDGLGLVFFPCDIETTVFTVFGLYTHPLPLLLDVVT